MSTVIGYPSFVGCDSGAGASDHALLSNLSWTVSGHTGTPGSLAAFDGTGAASLVTGGAHGDLLYFDGTNWVTLSPGISGQVLQTQGAGSAPVWTTSPGGVTDHALLSNLLWTASGHTGTANRVASFDALGAAAYLQIGVDLQAWDADLDALAALAGTGLVARTGAGTFTERTIQGTAGRISITNGDGVAADPAIDVGSDVILTTTAVGGDLSGFLPNPTVTDLTITGEVQGSILYFDGTNWAQLAPGTSGNFLQTQGAGADPVWASAAGGSTSLQGAYNNGAIITTASATDIAFTLASGGFVVSGAGVVSIGTPVEVSAFTVDTSGSLSLGSRDATDITMQANAAALRSVEVVATNAGAGDAEIELRADNLIRLQSAHAETLPAVSISQSGTGGDSADLYAGTSSPDGAVNGAPASLFMRDTGTGGQHWINVSSGASGTDWARVVEQDSHKTLRDLIHFVDEGPADGFASGMVADSTHAGVLLTQRVWYTSAARTSKILQLDVSYTGVFPTVEIWRMYAEDGSTVLVTMTDTIAYTASVETSRTRTWV